ncbi:MAG TPA: glycosyltransferase family 4 protein [Leptolyngbyaceae cyanobacterium M33_DOE_097]|uniref:Glycosyltransferase family 1 protein n=1 Tax=Oscillatoriales cyanobacterium SpSt-418 TaxID=2282169 RepID=A0A7C3KH62_9CYAN|nr:glycosyltransferase family 4 protein [Leptolyngbyaceae cyanobacterium M33_DOE_097]
MNDIRVVWLLPVAWFYWQPTLSELAQIFPQTKVFTGLFPGFAKGLEGKLDVEVVGQFRVIEINRNDDSYGDNFTYLSPAIIGHLLKSRPQVVFSSSFGVWTILALMLKPLLWYRVVIAYEGSSPGVDYRHSPLRLFVRRFMVWMADACISNSHAGRAYLTDILNAPKDRVFVEPYEIPDEKTLPGDSPEVSQNFEGLQRPVFLFVGHLIPRKGLPTLLEAGAMLRSRGYNDFTILVVGSGDQQAELEKFCQEHDLSDRVVWVGRVSYDKIGGYFKNSDVFVFPTQEDTWGVVALEAMLLSKPIICSKGAGTSELVMHSENGYVFSPQDANELADLMQKLLDEPELIQKMSQRSREIMARHNPEAAAQTLAEITKQLVRG